MGMWSRLRKTFRGGRQHLEIEEELRFHLDMDMAEGRGRREARLRLGNMTRIEEETRAMGIIEWLDSVVTDVRYGLRQLRKTPGLMAAIVLSLTIGIGAGTAIFSLVDAAILRPVPLKDPDALRIIEWTNPSFPEGVSNINGDFGPISGGRVQGSSVGPNLYRRLAREQTGFQASMGVADADSVAIAVDSSPAEQVSLQYVSSNFFQGLGVAPIIGRSFRADEDRVGQEPVVIVSHRFWMNQLQGAKDVFDRGVRINNVPAHIVGVAPPGFFGLRAGEWTDVYAPLAMRVAFTPGQQGSGPRGEDERDWWVRQIGRLKPGVPEAAARAQIAALFRNLAAPEGMSLVEPGKIPELITLPGRRGFGALNPKSARALWILMLLVGILLVIVCVNVATLLLSRSVRRQRESAVRLALGAARLRLFRQHFIESGILACLGGAAGLALGYVLARSIQLLFAGHDPNIVFDLHLDLRVLGYTAALSIVTAFLFGLAPAARSARADLNEALKTQMKSVVGGRLRLPQLLVSIQIALCLVALFAAGLLGRSLQNLQWTNIGFDRQNLAYATVNPWQAGYSAERVGPYVDRVREKLARLPGVIRVSYLEVRLLSGGGNLAFVSIPGQPLRVEKGVVTSTEGASMNRVADGALETLGVPLLAGRTIQPRDLRPDAKAAVVDEHFARRFFPNQNPLGQRFGFWGSKENDRYEIVGIVSDSRYNSLRDNPTPAVYAPYLPGDLKGHSIHFAIRAGIDSGLLIKEVRKAIASVDPAVPMTEFHTQTELIDRLLRTERLLAFLSSAFGFIALTLAAIGIGGLLAYSVARRTNEIGIRMAVGAAAADVVRMVVRDALWLAGAGITIGLPGAYVIGRILESTLFRLKPSDPRIMVLSLAALAAIALLAAWVPARRAARIEPITALREE